MPNERIRYTDKFDDPNLPGEMQMTVSFKPVSCGTELTIVQEGIPEVIPPEACYLGWQESLAQLAKLVDRRSPGSAAATTTALATGRTPCGRPPPFSPPRSR